MADFENEHEKIVGYVLGLRLDFRALKYLSDESARTDNVNTTKVFGDLFAYIEGLIWNRIVVTISWLYHKKAYQKDKKRTGAYIGI